MLQKQPQKFESEVDKRTKSFISFFLVIHQSICFKSV